MAFLFNKFQEAVKTLAKSPTFARDPRQLQFEADINRLFLYTSYNRLGRDAEEADAEEIIEMASKAFLADQQKLVQENIHAQIKSFSMSIYEILLPDSKRIGEAYELPPQPTAAPRRSGLGFAVGRHDQPTDHPGTSTNEIETDSLVHFYLGMGVGFTTGFWAICGAFFFNRTWRHAFSDLLMTLKIGCM
ncbi:uncharacterized protein LOC142636098 isoform X2 [Castanea sativa]|uniref:uncharacterized protein LOC142636098 isoform X2 n=1 Tax=Castanea sativa TaxID=21020 RepID=UPI003F649B75